MKKVVTPRHLKSWHIANIILDKGLFDEFRVWCYNHPKVKSQYRAGNLFLLNKGLRYEHVSNPVSVNMDTLLDYWFDQVKEVNLYA